MDRINVSEVKIVGNELKYLKECIDTRWVSSGGPFVKKFEKAFAEYCGTKYATSVSNGTHALHLALAAYGIKQGDEVIVPDLTFVATANAVKYIGAEPVLVDIEKDSWNIDPNKIEYEITKKTKAIIPVHLFGLPCEMDKINNIAEKYNLFVLEDAAEALGSKYKNKKAGNLGQAATFSLYGNKIITTGEGGMITTNDKKIYERANYLKNHAMSKERHYYHTELGYNYRLTNLQAAFGLGQLEGIEDLVNERQTIAAAYSKRLANVKGITLPKKADKDSRHLYWCYSILLEDDFGLTPLELAKKLRESNIETRPFFSSLSTMNFLTKKKYDCPISREISKKGIMLPTFSGMTDEQINFICEKIKEASV